MNLKNLSDAQLWDQTQDAVFRERSSITNVLHHLLEVDQRKLYAARGFGSLFEYAVKFLRYSESAANRRIQSMRAMRVDPEIEKKIESGNLNITVIAQAQTLFRQENIESPEKKEILKSLENKSSRVAEKILAERSTKPIPKETRRAVSATQTEVKVILDDEALNNLEQLKGMLAHKNPGASMGELIQIALKQAVEKLEPKSKSTYACRVYSAPKLISNTRYIPKATKSLVWKRDQGKCSYVDPKTGRKCNSNYKLELDHIIPFSIHGSSTPENLRLLCRIHNVFESRKFHGEWTDQFRFYDQKQTEK